MNPNTIPVLNSEQCRKAWQDFHYPAQKTYLAFYSSVLGGITTDAAYMSVPVDDHVVHRGDGVFEALKCRDGKAYLWEAHTERLQLSSRGLDLKVPGNLREIVAATVQAGLKKSGSQDCIIRIFLSRGPGQFSTNPYDSIGNQLYVVVTQLTDPPAEKYQSGVRIGRSLIPPKESWLAQLKTCNYLPNVMMKKEAVDRKIDFTIGFDSKGYLTEGSTENLIVLTQGNLLVRPHFDNILKGTTMARVLNLAESLNPQFHVKAGEKNMTEPDIISAKEVMMVGTTLDVLPVTEYNGKPIGNGKVGPVAQALLELLRVDQNSGPDVWNVLKDDSKPL
jgi:4-amino-4-deoxychorismate lyase